MAEAAKMIAIMVGALTLTVAGWKTLDYLEVRPILKKELVQLQNQIEQTSQAVLLIRFQLLMAKRENSQLTFEEQQELCRIAQALAYQAVPGCGFKGQ